MARTAAMATPCPRACFKSAKVPRRRVGHPRDKVTIGSPRSCANMYFWWPLTFNGTAMSTVILAVCPLALLMRPPSAWSASS
jgi:hypothetical protein